MHWSRSNGGPPARRGRFVLRGVALIVVSLVVAAALAVVGRHEQRSAASKEIAGMQSVLAVIGGKIDSPNLSGFRYGPPDCLAYHGAEMLLEYQLCFDSQGRLVEAVDRRPLQPTYYSLEYKPALSTIRFPRAEIDRLLQRTAAHVG